MTVLSTVPDSRSDAGPRPVPWRKMAWVTWRQHRAALAGVAALFGGVAGFMLIAGLRMHHAVVVANACRPVTSAVCGQESNGLNDWWHLAQDTSTLLLVLPPLLGAFVGAPVLARELETGTYRYAWTQGFGRDRWTAAKLVLLAAVLTGAAWALSLLFTWFYLPIQPDGTPFDPRLFGLREVAFPAWTMAGFAIGAFAGMLIRRVVPAMAATLAAWTGLALVAGHLRHYYPLAPLVTSDLGVLPGSAWVLRMWYTGPGGKPVSDATISQLFSRLPGPVQTSPGQFTTPNGPDPGQYLHQHGYTGWTSYQPASRFWPFQLIEGGWLLALSVLLITVTVWLVRRRAA
jgi:hypothetical protein